MKTRKPLKRVSAKRAPQNRKYTNLKKVFLDMNVMCFRCHYWVDRDDRTLHHFFGRTGELLCWVPGFRMACLPCHNIIETHRNEAVELGFRAPNNLFGRPSLVIPKTT
jgi:hypothetical protein